MDTDLNENLENVDFQELLQKLETLNQPPYSLALAGLLVGVICGLIFGRLIQNKLDQWKQDRLPLLPLGNIETNLTYSGTILGTTFFIGSTLQIFGFSPGISLTIASLLSLLTGGALWAQLENLMKQVESGNFKAIDFDNFDEFF